MYKCGISNFTKYKYTKDSCKASDPVNSGDDRWTAYGDTESFRRCKNSHYPEGNCRDGETVELISMYDSCDCDPNIFTRLGSKTCEELANTGVYSYEGSTIRPYCFKKGHDHHKNTTTNWGESCQGNLTTRGGNLSSVCKNKAGLVLYPECYCGAIFNLNSYDYICEKHSVWYIVCRDIEGEKLWNIVNNC